MRWKESDKGCTIFHMSESDQTYVFSSKHAPYSIRLVRYSAAFTPRISILQPVSLAAKRTFWPSLPMARES